MHVIAASGLGCNKPQHGQVSSAKPKRVIQYQLLYTVLCSSAPASDRLRRFAEATEEISDRNGATCDICLQRQQSLISQPVKKQPVKCWLQHRRLFEGMARRVFANLVCRHAFAQPSTMQP